MVPPFAPVFERQLLIGVPLLISYGSSIKYGNHPPIGLGENRVMEYSCALVSGMELAKNTQIDLNEDVNLAGKVILKLSTPLGIDPRLI